MVTLLHCNRHWKAQLDLVAVLPALLNDVECAGNHRRRLAAVDPQRRDLRPCGHTQMKREVYWHSSRDGQTNRLLKWIGCFDLNGHWLPGTNQGRDAAWRVRYCGQSTIWSRHPQMAHQLGPALMHIGGTAAKVRLEAEDIRVVVVV